MYILFFCILFIAEIIVATKIIEIIKKWDAKICEINSKVTKSSSILKTNILSLRISINKILLKITEIELNIKKRKEEYKIILIKNVITGLCFFLLNYNVKKALTFIDLLLSFKHFFDELSKSNHILKI